MSSVPTMSHEERPGRNYGLCAHRIMVLWFLVLRFLFCFLLFLFYYNFIFIFTVDSDTAMMKADNDIEVHERKKWSILPLSKQQQQQQQQRQRVFFVYITIYQYYLHLFSAICIMHLSGVFVRVVISLISTDSSGISQRTMTHWKNGTISTEWKHFGNIVEKGGKIQFP